MTDRRTSYKTYIIHGTNKDHPHLAYPKGHDTPMQALSAVARVLDSGYSDITSVECYQHLGREKLERQWCLTID